MPWRLAASVVVVLAGSALASPAAAKDVDDPQAWLTEHGVKDAASQLGDACCCVEVSVGRPAEAALSCREARAGGHAESADIAVTQVIRVVRAHKVVKVLEAWVELANLDLPRGSGPWIDLRVTIDRTGRALTIVDPGGAHYDCVHARGSTEFDAWLARVCASRGTYRWSGGRFVRAAR